MTGAVAGLDRRDAVDLGAAAIMVALTFSWGLNGVFAKLSYAGYSPIFVNVARSVIGASLIFLWCSYRGIPLFRRDGSLFFGLLAGALFGFEFILIFVGLEHTSVARSTLMLNTMPFWVLIGAHFLLGDRMSLMKFAGLALAFAGVALVFSDKLSRPGPDALVGDLMSLGGGLLWAATVLVIKSSRLRTIGAEKLLLYQLGVATLLAAPLLAVTGPALRNVSAFTTGMLLFQGIYVVAFTYLLWFWLIRRYPAAGLASFVFLTPAFGVLCGGLILGEPLSMHIFAALALIAAGLIIVNRPPRKAA